MLDEVQQVEQLLLQRLKMDYQILGSNDSSRHIPHHIKERQVLGLVGESWGTFPHHFVVWKRPLCLITQKRVSSPVQYEAP